MERDLLLQVFDVYRVSNNKLTRSAGCRIRSTWPVLKVKMIIFQSKANLDVKFLFWLNRQFFDHKNKEDLDKGFVWERK